MSEIKTELVFGVQVKITTPMRPSKAAIESMLNSSKSRINRLLEGAIGTALRNAIPGVAIELTNIKSDIVLKSVDE